MTIEKTTTRTQDRVDQFNDLMVRMNQAKEQWDKESAGLPKHKNHDDDDDDEQEHMLTQAIDFALEQGRGWGPGEKEAYIERILDDDFIPPIFANTVEEVEKSGLQDAFTTLIYDNQSPTVLMMQFRQKGNDSFALGKKNVVKNMQYYRDAINYYYEALAWADQIATVVPNDDNDDNDNDNNSDDNSDPTFTEMTLNQVKSTLCSNIALAHSLLKNWGHVRDYANKAVQYDKANVKGWYRLAKAHEMLRNWEQAGTALDAGLAVRDQASNRELLQLQCRLADQVRKARQLRQERERKRAQRVAQIKQVWKHCLSQQEVPSLYPRIRLGRVPLVTSVTDEEENDQDERIESQWHFHLPHSGRLPSIIESPTSTTAATTATTTIATWPVLFLYPSHQQSDYIDGFAEEDMFAVHMAQMFPEIDDSDNQRHETSIPWDDRNEFVCSQLAVYFEVHSCSRIDKTNKKRHEQEKALIHPDDVSLLDDQASCIRFYEACRALKGDEGPEMVQVVRAVERKRLYQQRKAWIRQHGSLWSKPNPHPVVRVHPAMTLHDILTDPRMVVPNFLPTFILFPENHPAHEAYLKEHKCIAVLQPEG